MMGLQAADYHLATGPVLPGQVFAVVECARCHTRWHAWLHYLPPPVPLCWQPPPYVCPHCRYGERIDEPNGGPHLHCLANGCPDPRCPATPHTADGTTLSYVNRPGKGVHSHTPIRRQSGNIRAGPKQARRKMATVLEVRKHVERP